MSPTKVPVVPPVEVSEGVAASLLRRFLHDPISPLPEPRLEGLSDQEAAGLEQVLARLKTTTHQLQESLAQQSAAVALLAQAIKQGPLDPKRSEASSNRLGEAGRLAPSEYKLSFGDLLKEHEALGDRRAWIERSVRHPDAVQHLSDTGRAEASGSGNGISIFVRAQQGGRGEDFAHLVVATRKGKDLQFQAAWRVFRSVISWTSDSKPLDLLRLFVDRYGLLFELAGRAPTKFVLYDAIPIPPGDVRRVFMRGVRDAGVANHNLIAQLGTRINASLGVVEISMAYVIDATVYGADVRARAISSERSSS